MPITVTPPADKFQSRDDLVAVHRAADRQRPREGPGPGAVRVERRVPWATSGPGRPRLGRVQRAQGRRLRARLPRAGPGQGRDCTSTSSSATCTRATASCRTAGTSRSWCRWRRPTCRRSSRTGRSCSTRFAPRWRPTPAGSIPTRPPGSPARSGSRPSRSARSATSPAARLVSFPVLGELIDLQRNLEVVRRGRGPGGRAAAQRPAAVPEADRRVDRVLGRRIAGRHRKRPGHRQPRPPGQEARRAGQGEQRTACGSPARRPRG